MRNFALTIFICGLVASYVFAEGLDTLIEVGRSQADIQKAYADETRNFEQVKNGIDNGSIKKGQSRDEIKRAYGEPVVVLKDAAAGREEWLYKPAAADHFKGIRAYLYFNKDGVLDEATVTGQAEGKK